MNQNLSKDYRTRIYHHYVSAARTSRTPLDIAALRPRMPSLNKIIRRHFPIDKDSRILDLGCGHGAFLYACQKAGYHNHVGIDASPDQVQEAERLTIKGVTLGDMNEELKALPAESQDIVITFDVIEHLTKQELLVFVDEVHRVLCGGGKWIIHVPNGESLFGSKARYADFTHENAFTQDSLTQLLKASNFAEVVCEEDAPVVHGIKSAGRWIIWKWIRGILRFYLVVETGSAQGAIFSQNFLCVATKISQ